MSLLASLAMYDWPEIQGANDALWGFVGERLRHRGIAAPDKLDRSKRYSEYWLCPNLLLAQTCGYPFAAELLGKVALVGTPCYSAPGCAGSDYSSVVIANKASGIRSLQDIGRATAAINSERSQSGLWALRAAIAAAEGAGAPARALLSGGHRESLRLVAGGTADVAAIDAVCWALAQLYERDAADRVVVIAESPSAPGLPLITSREAPEETLVALKAALVAALATPALAAARAELLLSGFEPLPESAYDRILELKRQALGKPFPRVEPA